MTDTPQPPQDRPLVTFALFAYNQEKYIREAVEGAFSQTYEPLEIILSDDCSSDQTYQIMQEMAAAYEGPHKVRVRQSDANAGVLNHVLVVAKQSTGKIFVVSAGDDVSFPERSEIIYSKFEDENIYAVSSDDVIIDEFGDEKSWDLERYKRRNLWHSKDPTWVHGATAAYRTIFLKSLPLSGANVFYEDMVFSDILRAIKKCSIWVPVPLISYRYHLHNLSNRISTSSSTESIEFKSIERWTRAHGAKIYCLEVLSTLAARGEKISSSALRQMRGEERYLFHAKNWTKNGFIARLKMLYYSVHHGNTKSSLVRVLGPSVFYALKGLKGFHRGA